MSDSGDFISNLVLDPVKVESNIEVAKDVFVLSYIRNSVFTAGQVVAIAIIENAEPRLYSIASGNQDDMISLLYNVKQDGELSPDLAEINSGDTLFVSAPFGSFFGTTEPAVFIASGTGVAPFASMLRSGMTENKTLIHGGRILESFYFKDELTDILGEENYIRCCS